MYIFSASKNLVLQKSKSSKKRMYVPKVSVKQKKCRVHNYIYVYEVNMNVLVSSLEIP